MTRKLRLFGATVLAGAVLAVSAHAGETAQALSLKPVAADLAWKTYVLNAPGDYATPASATVEGEASAVSTVEGLLAQGGGVTTLTAKADGGTRIIVDLGRLASGFVEIGVTKASGAPIRAAYAEARQYLRRIGDASNDPQDFFYNGRTLGVDDDPDGRADVFAAPPGATTLVSKGLRGSQRYIAISLDGPGEVSIDFIRVRQTNFQGRYDGRFLSSDHELNRAWYASAYSLDLSTVRDARRDAKAPWVIIDGPKRDRVLYAQDMWLAGLSGYYQSAAYRAAIRDSLNVFACQQYPDGSLPAVSLVYVPCDPKDPGPPDGPPEGYGPPGEAAMARLDGFSIWWVVGLADYVKYTGDRAFAAAMLPVARRILDFTASHATQDLLFRTDNYDGKYGFSWHTPDKSTGVDSSINAAYVEALKGLAGLERSIAKDPAAAAALERRAEKVHAAVVAKLWDPQAGAMILNSEDPKRDHTADANAIALLLGVLDEDKAKSAMAFIDKKLATPYGTANSEYSDNPYMSQYISPYIMALETLGRFRYGDGKGALDLVRKAWPHMIDNGPGTPWEEVGVNGSPSIPRPGSSLVEGEHVDLAHAWSTAVPVLSREVLGVRPKADGYREWMVAPKPVDLEWAQGEVPAANGAIAVRWTRGKENSAFVLTVEAPEGTRGKVAMPMLGKGRTIAMNGKVVWKNGRPSGGAKAALDGDAVVFSGVQGKQTFAWVAP